MTITMMTASAITPMLLRKAAALTPARLIRVTSTMIADCPSASFDRRWTARPMPNQLADERHHADRLAHPLTTTWAMISHQPPCQASHCCFGASLLMIWYTPPDSGKAETSCATASPTLKTCSAPPRRNGHNDAGPKKPEADDHRREEHRADRDGGELHSERGEQAEGAIELLLVSELGEDVASALATSSAVSAMCATASESSDLGRLWSRVMALSVSGCRGAGDQ